jgi:phosphate-selective porin OprO/OprP
MEGSTSSNELLTLERSNLPNNFWFPSLFIPGVSAEHVNEEYRFTMGLFSGGSASPEFGNFDGSVFGLVTAGRDFAKELDAKEAILALHWVVQDSDPDNTYTRPHEQVTSINFRYEKDRWGWRGDLSGSIGGADQADLIGVVLIPYLNLDERWQLVARATFLESDGPDGIRLARYENRLSTERGDSFQDIYVGLNRYFKGHQLKWQSGISYTRLDDSADGTGDYEGWTCSSGIRISW